MGAGQRAHQARAQGLMGAVGSPSWRSMLPTTAALRAQCRCTGLPDCSPPTPTTPVTDTRNLEVLAWPHHPQGLSKCHRAPTAREGVKVWAGGYGGHQGDQAMEGEAGVKATAGLTRGSPGQRGG